MNYSARSAAVFYAANVGAAAIAAATILIPGAPLLSIALNANVLATVLLPVALVFMVMLANDRHLMGDHANGRIHNWIVGAIVMFVAASGTAYAVDSFLRVIHVVS
jgi:Mn2+/Fe2+ NRAMP family transporter